MEDIVLYHGSDQVVQKPLFGFGKSDNDYGSGFYTTIDFTRASEWALSTGKPGSAYVNEYIINIDDLKVLYLDSYGVLSWIAEVIAHRGTRDELTAMIGGEIIKRYKVNTDDADIIVGYRADDSYIDIVDAFLRNQLSIAEVENLFRRGELGLQYFIKSEHAFSTLKFSKATDVGKNNFENIAESRARKEVSKFLDRRNYQIQVEGYNVPGFVARDAITNKLVYNSEYNYYYIESEGDKNVQSASSF